MARVKPGGAERWLSNASQARGSYLDGVRNPRRPWAEATKAARDTWKQGVMQAANEGRFEKGITTNAAEKWAENAVQLGGDRFVQGVQLAQTAYAEGVAPYLQEIERINLPTRYPAGDPRNIERVKAVSTALHNKKVGK